MDKIQLYPQLSIQMPRGFREGWDGKDAANQHRSKNKIKGGGGVDGMEWNVREKTLRIVSDTLSHYFLLLPTKN